MGWIWQTFLDWLSNIFVWMFDPVSIYHGILLFLKFLFEQTAGLLRIGNVEPLFARGPVVDAMPDAFNLMLWWMSPILDPGVVKVCLSATLYTWLFFLMLKFGFYIKGHFWSTSH